MTTIPARRTHLKMHEVMTRWTWSENDLRDVIMNGTLVPSYFINKPLWPVPQPQPKLPAVFKNEWMYLLDFRQVSAVEGYFRRLADTCDALKAGDTVFKFDGNGYTKDHLISLADVLANGAVMMEEVTRYEEFIERELSTGITSEKRRWWNIENDIFILAKTKEGDAKNAGRGVNQSGARAGKYPISAISESIASDLQNAEKAAGRSRKIGGKSIENYLRANGWT